LKKILLTGNQGYIGTVLTKILKKKKYTVIGYDTGYYKDCLVSEDCKPDFQIKKDLRSVNGKDLDNIDFVIHLAGLSNDPLGELKKEITNEINYLATLKLVKLAKKNKVKRFIFASTQSIYGLSKLKIELDEDFSKKNPISTYAITKYKAERKLHNMSSDDFVTTSLRPSTVFGPSPRLRTDIVFNNLLASAYINSKIEIWGNGKPWRPVIHVDDVCRAFLACLIAPPEIVNKQSFNVGILNGNFTVKQLANKAKDYLPYSKIFLLNKLNFDERSYRVSFKKIYRILKNYYNPIWDLDNGAEQLISFYKKINLKNIIKEDRITNRLRQLKYLKEKNIINNKLFFR
jgi:nucleoside-diphosphate-sugar epimerase